MHLIRRTAAVASTALAAAVAVAATAVVGALLWRATSARLPRPELVALRPIERLVPWLPRLLGVHLGVSLLALSRSGAVLDPSAGSVRRLPTRRLSGAPAPARQPVG